MRVTVSGGTGTLGLASVGMLVRAGHTVRALVRSPEKFQRLSGEERVEVVTGDILDRASVAAVMEGADAVVHCVSFPLREFATNWDALRHVFEGMGSGAHLVYPSQAWVHGPPAEGAGNRVREQSALPRLGQQAADIEKAVVAQGGTVVRLPWCYGPGVRKGLTHSIFERLLAGKTIWFPGDLDRALNLIYIEDAARALVAPLGRRLARGAVYDAAGFPPMAPRAFASLVSQVAGQPVRLRALPSRWLRLSAPLHRKAREWRELSKLIEGLVAELDGTGILRELGWLAEVDHRDGVRRTVRWLRRAVA